MSLHSTTEFQNLTNALATHLCAAASDFIRGHHLGQFDIPGLDQMTHSINQVSGEILMFGANTWPEAAV